MWVKKKYNDVTALQLAHYMYNDIAWGVPDAVLVSKTNYSNCIINGTIGICCLRIQQLNVVVRSWNWSERKCCINGGNDEQKRALSSHTEAVRVYPVADIFQEYCHDNWVKEFHFLPLLQPLLGENWIMAFNLLFNFCLCYGCARFHALHLIQFL